MRRALVIGTILALLSLIATIDACARDSCKDMGSPHSVARCERESVMPG